MFSKKIIENYVSLRSSATMDTLTHENINLCLDYKRKTRCSHGVPSLLFPDFLFVFSFFEEKMSHNMRYFVDLFGCPTLFP